MKQKGFAPVLIILLIAILGVVGYLGYKNFQITNQEFKQQSTISPVPSQAPNTSNYVQGELIVTFNNGTTYKEAKDFFTNNGISTWTEDYWTATKFIPTDDTSLTTIDMFKIDVPAGKEDEFIAKLSGDKIIRAVSKNFILHVD